MSRPKRCRIIQTPPLIDGFEPIGSSCCKNKTVELLVEEYEAFRLCDYEGLSQEEAASHLDVSRPTFTRIYASVRKKIAQAFVEGHAIAIRGGKFEFSEEWSKCSTCNQRFQTNENSECCPHCKSNNLININESYSHCCSEKSKNCNHNN